MLARLKKIFEIFSILLSYSQLSLRLRGVAAQLSYKHNMSNIGIWALGVVATLLVSGAILALVAPKRITITTRQTIAAPASVVYDMLRHQRRYPSWSPWLAADPKQKHSFAGTDGQVGNTFTWDGVAEKSHGTQTVTKLAANKEVLLVCNITVPFQSNPSFQYLLEPTENGTLVLQTFDTEMPPPANIFGLLFGLKKEIAAKNKTTLELLDAAVQSELNKIGLAEQQN